MTSAAQAFYFGPVGGELFGWLHLPDGAGRQPLGLLVCNPFGFEEVCAHRSLKAFAQAAAGAGFAAMRFDHAGCGNSQGDEFDADVPGRWLNGVRLAIDTLKARSGVAQVVLLGVRLGATLAALASVGRDDVAGLIAIAPVVRGRGYIRELTMLGQSGSLGPATATGLLESAGFLLTQATADQVSQIDLRKMEQRPAPRVLIVGRDDLDGGSGWDAPLEALGTQVSVERWTGYAGMMEDPQRAVVPRPLVEGVVRCLQGWSTGLPAAAPVAVLPLPQALHLAATTGRAVVERPVQVETGAGTRLFGVLSEPDAPACPKRRPAVLMLNSGAVHHIGPNRLWVRLARQWAARGLMVLRLDLSGIGDSAPRTGAEDNVVYSAHAMQDVAAALDFLHRDVQAGECHLVGLCSGAYHALKAAVAGHDVVSSTMINPLTYFWTDGMSLGDVKDYELAELTSRYRGKVFTAEPWLRLLRGQLDLRVIVEVGLRRLWSTLAPPLVELARWLHLPLRHDLAGELDKAVGRGTRLRFIFAANAPGFDLLHKQSGRAIDRLLARQLASIDFVPGADHTFTRLEARERLVEVLDRMAPTPGPCDASA
jgi:alpha-beta hydrolase superfamily lysophospholipase